MNFPYYLSLLTLLIFPYLGLLLCRYFPMGRTQYLTKRLVAFFLVHNVLFLLHFSLKGDYADYSIFSVEYLFLCYLLFRLKPKSIYIKILKVLGIIGISLGFVVGLFGIFLFIVASQDYKADRTFYLESGNSKYETRRYSMAFVTFENARYTFETYREYSYLPFEKKIDKTNFFDDKTNLNIDEDELKIVVQTSDSKRQILFRDHQGNVFSKSLD